MKTTDKQIGLDVHQDTSVIAMSVPVVRSPICRSLLAGDPGVTARDRIKTLAAPPPASTTEKIQSA